MRNLGEASLQLGCEPDIAEHEACLCCKVGEQLFFDWCQGFTRTFVDAERTKQLALISHWDDSAHAWYRRRELPGDVDNGWRQSVTDRPRSDRGDRVSQPHPDVCP